MTSLIYLRSPIKKITRDKCTDILYSYLLRFVNLFNIFWLFYLLYVLNTASIKRCKMHLLTRVGCKLFGIKQKRLVSMHRLSCGSSLFYLFTYFLYSSANARNAGSAPTTFALSVQYAILTYPFTPKSSQGTTRSSCALARS